MKYPGYIFLMLLIISSATTAAEVFVNWRAGYHVTYPEDWYHVPYRTVNFFLTSQDIYPTDFDYDAVLAQEADDAFYNVPYVFLTFLPTGELKPAQIDSVVQALSDEYGRSYKEGSLTSGDRPFPLDMPIYDRSFRAVAVKTRITSETTDKYFLEMRKFYERGIAVFLCYAPRAMYNEAQPIFLSILNSFSTSNLEKAAPKDSFQIVDLSERDLQEYDDSDFPEPGSGKETSPGTTRTILIIILVVLVTGAAVYFVILKR